MRQASRSPTETAIVDKAPCNLATEEESTHDCESFPLHYLIWQETRICGILRKSCLLGPNWWYRIQLADATLTPETFEQSTVHGKPLSAYAQAFCIIANGWYHVAWKPQWVPADSITWELRAAFWRQMPSRFWTLSRPLEEDMIWHEEAEQYINLSHKRTEHLCARRSCEVCGVECESKLWQLG